MLDQILNKSFKFKNPILLKLLALMALLRFVLLMHKKKTQNIVKKYFKKLVGKFFREYKHYSVQEKILDRLDSF